eukprot:113597-Karenia_brevis.AAC.2
MPTKQQLFVSRSLPNNNNFRKSLYRYKYAKKTTNGELKTTEDDIFLNVNVLMIEFCHKRNRFVDGTPRIFYVVTGSSQIGRGIQTQLSWTSRAFCAGHRKHRLLPSHVVERRY